MLGSLLCLLWLAIGLGVVVAQDDKDSAKSKESRLRILDSPIPLLQGDSLLPDEIYLRRNYS